MTKKIGPFVVNPEVGYWFAVVRAQLGLPDLLWVGMSVKSSNWMANCMTRQHKRSNHWNTLDGGGRYKLGQHFVLLFMAAAASAGRRAASRNSSAIWDAVLFSVKHKKENTSETSRSSRCRTGICLTRSAVTVLANCECNSIGYNCVTSPLSFLSLCGE